MQASPDKKTGTRGVETGRKAMRVLIFAALPSAPIPQAPERLRAFLDNGYQVTWTGWRAIRSGGASGGIVVASEVGDCAWHELCAGPKTRPGLPKRDKGVISVFAQPPRFSRVSSRKKSKHRAMDGRAIGARFGFGWVPGPVMEKTAAPAAGGGGRAKPNLVSPRFWLMAFFGSFPPLPRCPSMRPGKTHHWAAVKGCLDICPPKAFPAPYKLGARRYFLSKD
ncbi:MAG: hypothetical protein CM15mP55_2600 [Hyphomicrobiales bacterium]|nr:MAG: hypothetical protein CM15mP55_2600 [Hyphomicrobiales bacterium]